MIAVLTAKGGTAHYSVVMDGFTLINSIISNLQFIFTRVLLI